MTSGVFPPDPMEGFPPGAAEGEPTSAGIVHLAAGGVGFLALAGAAFVVGGWLASAWIQVYRTVPHPDADRRAAS